MSENETRTPNGGAPAAGEEQTGELPVSARPALDLDETAPTVPLDGPVTRPADTESFQPIMNDIWTGLRRLPNYARLATALARDPRVPKPAKAALVAGGGYLLSPIDLIPGIIPVAGQIDDLYVVLTALQQAVRLTPDEVAREHLERAGVQRSDIDDDLRAIRRLVKLAAVKTARYGWKMARQAGQEMLQLANDARDRARKGPDHEPL